MMMMESAFPNCVDTQRKWLSSSRGGSKQRHGCHACVEWRRHRKTELAKSKKRETEKKQKWRRKQEQFWFRLSSCSVSFALRFFERAERPKGKEEERGGGGPLPLTYYKLRNISNVP